MKEDNLNSFWAELIVEELIRLGVDHFCISPGSRSTPLVVAVARNEKAESMICYDERNSAFHAIGYAKATNKPAVVIVTSGTAVANLYPAVVEASMNNVPMLVLSADRPPELSDTGANQAINQQGFFGEYVRWHFDLPCPSSLTPPEMVLTTLDQAIHRTKASNSGPVHINCRFREPLEPAEIKVDYAYALKLKRWVKSEKPFTKYTATSKTVDPEEIESLVGILNRAKRGLLVVGELKSSRERESVLRLMEKLNWSVYTDVTSGLRLTACSSHIIRYFDQELLSVEFNESVQPSVVLHLGGRVTSKRMGLFLDENRPKHYIVVKDAPCRYDPIHAVTQAVDADISQVCSLICGKVDEKEASEYSKFFDGKAAEVQAVVADMIEREKSLCEPFVARYLSENVPDGSNLFLSSSMPIRDVDLYGVSGREDVNVAANRGVSGIDGVISSAGGFAAGNKNLTTLLIGDLAFIHDVNSLAGVKRFDLPVIIVVVNNGGGGIFHFLPISKSEDVFEEYFATPHKFCFEGVSKTFGLDYYMPTDKESFADVYTKAISNGKPAVIEVVTNRDNNLKIRRDIKKNIIKVLDESADI